MCLFGHYCIHKTIRALHMRSPNIEYLLNEEWHLFVCILPGPN